MTTTKLLPRHRKRRGKMYKEFIENNIFTTELYSKEDYIRIVQVDKITGCTHKVIITKEILPLLKKLLSASAVER